MIDEWMIQLDYVAFTNYKIHDKIANLFSDFGRRMMSVYVVQLIDKKMRNIFQRIYGQKSPEFIQN